MRYREASYREEIDAYEQSLTLQSDTQYAKFVQAVEKKNRKVDAGMKRRWERDYDRKKKNMVDFARSSAEKFNALIYNELVGTVKRLTQLSQTAFDNYSTSFALLMEQLLIANNKTELLTVTKMYNNGDFDKTFEQVRILNQQQKENEKNSNVIANSDSNDNHELSQKLGETNIIERATAEQPTESTECVGHEQSGEIQNGMVSESI